MKRPKPSKLAEYAIFHGACQKISELTPLIRLLRKRKLFTVVEIGTAKGGTLWLWCQLAMPTARVVSIDLPGGSFGGGFSVNEMKRLKTYSQLQQSLDFLRLDSQCVSTVDILKQQLNERKIDFLFIDGDHRYRSVKRDFELYSPLVREDGLIALHDVLPHPKVQDCEVDRFWIEIKESFTHWEFLDEGDDRGWGKWGGLGVIKFRRDFKINPPSNKVRDSFRRRNHASN